MDRDGVRIVDVCGLRQERRRDLEMVSVDGLATTYLGQCILIVALTDDFNRRRSLKLGILCDQDSPGHARRGAFVDFVVKQKQKTLLGLATDVFQEMTGGRFGFSADFQIVDTETGQPRSPRTLSGGERFLASLALSLGLVELAARGGGRLDSLFLDEGFGSLDNDSLEDALDALEKVAGHGRMIALITHIRAVADRLPRVLKVTRTPTGSQARWLSRAESDADAETEISEGMLT